MKKGLFVMIFLGLFPVSSCVHANGWETHGPYGERVISLALDPKDSLLIYAGTYNGIYKTTDGGENWEITSLNSYWIYDIKVDSHQNVYAGTYKNGIFKSNDTGNTWIQINNGLINLCIHEIAIDPVNDSIIYVGTFSRYGIYAEALYKSTNAGANWVSLGFDSMSVIAIAIHPTAPETVYVASCSSSYYAGGIYKSANSGISWDKKADFYPRGLTISPSQPNILYAATLESNNMLFKTINSGETWTSQTFPCDPEGHLSSAAITIDPSNDSIIYLGSVLDMPCMWAKGTLYKSIDAGGSWNKAMFGGLPEYPIHQIIIDPRNTNKVYVTSDGPGVFRSNDKGDSWKWMSNGMQLRPAYSISINPIAGTVFCATGGGVYKSIDFGESWINKSTGMEHRSLGINVAPSGPDTIYAGASDWTYSSYRSFDGGETWISSPYGLEKIAINPLNAKVYYAVGHLMNSRVYKSVDAGSTASIIDTVWGARAVTIDPVDTSVVYTGGYDSDSSWVHKSTDGGSSWQDMSEGLPNKWYVRDLKINPFDHQILYSSVDSGGPYNYYKGRFFRYNGSLWEERGNGLDTFVVYSIAVDDSNAGWLYLGTNGGGVYRTTNEGLNWTQMNDGLWNLSVRSVAIDPTNHKRVYASTNSGTYVTMTTGVEENPVDKILQGLSISPNPLFKDTYISYQVSTTTHLSLKIYNVSGQLMHTLIEKKILPGRYKTYWNTEELAGGIYFARLTTGKYTSTKKLILIK